MHVDKLCCFDKFNCNLEPGAVHKFDIIIVSNSSVNITWEPPLLLNGIIISYHINIISLTAKEKLINTWEIDSGKVLHITINQLGITNYNTTSYSHLFIFIEPYVPYLVDITAATIIGKGEISQKTFFTLETSTTI